MCFQEKRYDLFFLFNSKPSKNLSQTAGFSFESIMPKPKETKEVPGIIKKTISKHGVGDKRHQRQEIGVAEDPFMLVTKKMGYDPTKKDTEISTPASTSIKFTDDLLTLRCPINSNTAR